MEDPYVSKKQKRSALLQEIEPCHKAKIAYVMFWAVICPEEAKRARNLI